MNKRIKNILLILVLLVGIFVSNKLYLQEDYYNNATENIEEITKGEYEGYETYYLHPGNYTLTFGVESADKFTVQIIKIDTSEVLSEKNFLSNNGEYSIDFEISTLTKGVKAKIYSEDSIENFTTAYYSSNGTVYNDRIVIISLILLAFFISYYFIKTKKNTILFLCMLAGFVSLPLISKDLKFGHDLFFHIDRIFNIAVQYGKGYIIPRLSDTSVNSFGSITPMMYPELFLYFPGLLVYFNVSVVFAYKLLCVLINFATVFVSYYVVNKTFNHKAGLIFAFLYAINPYRLNEIFVRAALGELLAMAFIPLAFYGLYLLIQVNYKKGLFVSIIGISLVFQSNILGTFIFLIFGFIYAAIYVLFNWKKFFNDKKRLLYIIMAALLTVSINAYFVIPFLRLQDGTYFVINNRKSLSTHAGSLYRLFADIYNTNISVNGMSISIGSGSLIGMIVVALLLKNKADLKQKGTILVSLLLGLLGLFLSSELFPWNFVQYNGLLPDVLGVIQFPWRFQMMSCLFISLSTAVALSQLENKKSVITIGVVLLCLISGLNCMNGYITNNPVMLNKSDGDSPDINSDYFRMTDSLENVKGVIRNRNISSDNIDASYSYKQDGKRQIIEYKSVLTDTNVELPIYYYRDIFNVEINGEKAEFECGSSDTILVSISKEQGPDGIIEVSLDNNFFLIPDLITLVSIVLVLTSYIRYKKEEKLISSK